MRRYGQHFLVREEVGDAIVAAAAPDANDFVMEIGPGKGAITRKLAARAGMLVAIEIDSELAGQLEDEYVGRDDVRIIRADVLECDIGSILEIGAALPGRRMVVANLPYGITSPVLRRLFEASAPFSQFVLMVQMEVAERLVAPAGGAGRSVLSLMAQYYTEPSILMRVGPECFHPPPAVESAVVRLSVRSQPPTGVDCGADELFRVVEAGFARRRKTIRNALAAGAGNLLPRLAPDRVDQALRAASVDPMLRAEQMSMEQFCALAVAVGADSTGDSR